MPTVFVIPVRSFRLGKRRLAAALDDSARARLGRELAHHVAATVAAADHLPLVVTADAEVATWATVSGFPSVPDPGSGLDTAAGVGVAWARQAQSEWVVLHADLPLLTVGDVDRLSQALGEGRQPIAPSSDGGTSALGSFGEFRFTFGVGSFHRHLGRLSSPDVVVRLGLALDIDSTDDLAAARTRNPRNPVLS